MASLRIISEVIPLERAAEFGKMLQSNSMLHTVVFLDCKFSKEASKSLLEGLAANKTLEQAHFSECDFNNMGAHSKRLALATNPNIVASGVLSHMLQTNSSLTHLRLSACNLDDTDAHDLASGLRVNSSLRSLDVQNNFFSGIALEFLVATLEANRNVASMDIRGNVAMWKSEQAVALFAQALPKMKALKALRMDGTALTVAHTKLIVDAIAKNTKLEHIDLTPSDDDKPRLDLYLDANKFGRGLISQETEAPPALWVNVLSRIALHSTPSVMSLDQR
jgi:Ran GTPase-activating protein (RanGAP) involved in mRNA processing and transport